MKYDDFGNAIPKEKMLEHSIFVDNCVAVSSNVKIANGSIE